MRCVRQQESDGLEVVSLSCQYRLVEVFRYAYARGQGIETGRQDASGNDVERVAPHGPPSRLFFELFPRAAVQSGCLWSDVGEVEGAVVLFLRTGTVGRRAEMPAVVSAPLVRGGGGGGISGFYYGGVGYEPVAAFGLAGGRILARQDVGHPRSLPVRRIVPQRISALCVPDEDVAAVERGQFQRAGHASGSGCGRFRCRLRSGISFVAGLSVRHVADVGAKVPGIPCGVLRVCLVGYCKRGAAGYGVMQAVVVIQLACHGEQQEECRTCQAVAAPFPVCRSVPAFVHSFRMLAAKIVSGRGKRFPPLPVFPFSG